MTTPLTAHDHMTPLNKIPADAPVTWGVFRKVFLPWFDIVRKLAPRLKSIEKRLDLADARIEALKTLFELSPSGLDADATLRSLETIASGVGGISGELANMPVADDLRNLVILYAAGRLPQRLRGEMANGLGITLDELL